MFFLGDHRTYVFEILTLSHSCRYLVRSISIVFSCVRRSTFSVRSLLCVVMSRTIVGESFFETNGTWFNYIVAYIIYTNTFSQFKFLENEYKISLTYVYQRSKRINFNGRPIKNGTARYIFHNR